MNKTEVIEQVGDPKWVEKGTSEFGKYKILHYGRRLKVNLLGGEVVQVSTKARKQKTPEGIGVGSRRKAVKKNVPGVVCDNVSGLKSCHVNDFLPGEIVTVFRLKHRRVTQVDIGRVID